MAFDINEARQIIEDAKKRGLIGSQDTPLGSAKPPEKAPAKTTENGTVLPDWLQKSLADPSIPESGSFNQSSDSRD